MLLVAAGIVFVADVVLAATDVDAGLFGLGSVGVDLLIGQQLCLLAALLVSGLALN